MDRAQDEDVTLLDELELVEDQLRTPAVRGPLELDGVLALVAQQPAPLAATVVRGELVAPVDELVDAFVITLVASPQTQRTYQRACRRFARWLGPLGAADELLAAWTRTLVGAERDSREHAAVTQQLIAVLARSQSRARREDAAALRGESRQARRQARAVRQQRGPSASE